MSYSMQISGTCCKKGDVYSAPSTDGVGGGYRYAHSSGFMRQDQAYGLPLMKGDMRPTNNPC